MKVIFVFNSSYPIGAVSTHRTHNLAKGLFFAGAEVELIVAHPTEKQENVLNKNAKGCFEGVNYKYISKSTIRHNNLLLRKLKDYFCHLKIFFYVLLNKSKSNALIVIGPSFDFRNLLPFAAKIAGMKSFIEINEFPFVGKEKAISSKLKRWFFMHLIIPFYDGHIVISENLKNYISRYKSKKSKVIKIPIITERIKQWGKNEQSPFDVPYLFHAGSLFEQKDGILTVIEAFGVAIKKLDSPIKYVFTGKVENSPHNSDILKLIEKYQLKDKIVFTGYIQESQLSRYYINASLAIVHKYDTLQNRYCFATKLAEYIKYGVPVITTNVGEAKYFFEDEINAYICEEDVNSLANKIIYAFKNQCKTKEIAKNAQLLIENHFDINMQGKRLYKLIDAML